MPCYDPVAPWTDDEKADQSAAARLLCRILTPRVRDADPEIPREYLLWFRGHRVIDMRRAKDSCFGRIDPFEVTAAEEDIAKATELLKDKP